MKSNPFRHVLLGLLFVLLDIRIWGVDLILPDFLGYILVMLGLGKLSSEHSSFRAAWCLAVAMAVLSLAGLFRMEIDMGTRLEFRSQLVAQVSGNLRHLVPSEVGSTTLTKLSEDTAALDRQRIANPEEDGNSVWAKYSDGTSLLLLRYPSLEVVHSTMDKKAEQDYGESYFGANTGIEIGRGKVGSNSVDVSRYILKEGGGKAALLLWRRGKSWWNPWSWFNPGVLGGASQLLIVEGHRDSVKAFESHLQSASHIEQPRIILSPFVLPLLLGGLVQLLLVWYLCSGIHQLALTQGQERLAKIARRRRRTYLVVTIMGWVFPLLMFFSRRFVMAPRRMLFGVTIGSAIQFLVLLLIIGLVRKAAIQLSLKAQEA